MDFIFFNLNCYSLWLIIGFTLLLAEFIIFPGLGILFLGLGALTNAIVTYYYPTSLQYQLFAFGLFSSLWFMLLWWPLKQYTYNKNSPNNYQDIINNEAEVWSAELNSQTIGQIKWSGTIMNAKLTCLSQDATAYSQEIVIIKKIEGNIAICERKS